MTAGLALDRGSGHRVDRTQISKPQAARRQISYTRPPLTAYQERAIFCPHRYGLIEASTKAGKTTGCLIWLLEQAIFRGGANRNFWWVAPIFAQTDIAFNRMKAAIPRGIYTSNETDHTITLVNGAVIWFKSADKPDSLYGEDVYAAVVDEASRTKMETWIAIRSTLTFTEGPVRIIGNVKGRKNWAYKMARRAEAERGEGNMLYSRITADDAVAAGVLKKSEIDDARSQMSEDEFNELYMADAPGDDTTIYTAFSDNNVTEFAQDHGGDLLIGMDFNVNPMCASIANKAGDQLHIFREIALPNSDTETMCKKIRAIYPNRKITVYPDPSGKRRVTSAKVGQTDFSIIREHGMKISAPHRAMPVVDRINCVNRALCDARGVRRVFINPSCKKSIISFEEHEYVENSNTPDKKSGYDHMNDANGYLISRLYPIVKYVTGTRDLDI